MMQVLMFMFFLRLGASPAVRSGAVPVLPRDVLRVPGAPSGAALRGDAPHAPHPHGRAVRGEYQASSTH